MDLPDLRPLSGASNSAVRSGAKRSFEVDPEEGLDGVKKVKTRDLETVVRCEGSRTYNPGHSNTIDATGHNQGSGDHTKDDEHSQIVEEETFTVLNVTTQVTTENKFLEPNAACLNSGCGGGTRSSVNNAVAEHNKEISGLHLPTKVDRECQSQSMVSTGLGVYLNVIDLSGTVDPNPFYPYKKLGQLKSTDAASECGSTTGPLEESGPLKMWKEMKQNGFLSSSNLSSSHGGIPMPKQRGRQPRKKKGDEHKKRPEISKKEQANRFTKNAAPSGLLSGLNPGIINHVRNSKQVYSIIKAILQSEHADVQNQNRFCDASAKGNKDNNCQSKYLSGSHDFTTKQFTPRNNLSCDTSWVPEYDDTLTLKLSLKSENASTGSLNDSLASQETDSSLSCKAATVAFQWLELLHEDIKGRLAALRRSKKRVKNVIQTELPHLLSAEFAHSQENNPCIENSLEAGCSRKAMLDMHTGRWISLFNEMDRVLNEEGKRLEKWLEQVQHMQSECDKGLKYVNMDGLSLLGSLQDCRLKKPDARQQECAVRAAAASLYSTCNFLENLSCF